MQSSTWQLTSSQVDALVSARHGDPFALLGPHPTEAGIVVRVLAPDAERVRVISPDGEVLVDLEKRHGEGLFEGLIKTQKTVPAYRLQAGDALRQWEYEDPYRFSPVWGEMDDYLFGEGKHKQLYKKLGAHLCAHEGVEGVTFAVWAPHARRVSVVGDFNAWDGRRHQMRRRITSGVWEIFIPAVRAGAIYKYEIIAADGRLLPLKADPFAFASQLRPETGSIVAAPDQFTWSDQAYLEQAARNCARKSPMSIYEVHAGSWRRGPDNRYLGWDELTAQLIPYVHEMGFTHIEFMPLSEYPFDGSWGYQPIGLFSPTSRFGAREGLARFVDAAHARGIGIILDWVPAHFPTDEHGLALFDGEALYEDADPNRGYHPDWQTAIYDFGRPEVANFLAANAKYWLELFHVDALRVDAVASMLYLDYSRQNGNWSANIYGGNTNLEAVSFLQMVNEWAYGEVPHAITIAEESTAWPRVSQPAYAGGLGFGFKWNMGWMHDTLDYMACDPVYRRWHHNKLTFGLLYAFSENFVLPLSHDEVVHGKKSLIRKMSGDIWQKFATLRAYYGFMWAHPGKKLVFMGQEFGQWEEWSADKSLDWQLTGLDWHRGLQLLMRDLNQLYRTHKAFYLYDCEPQGFQWLNADDAENSVYAFMRRAEAQDGDIIAVSNFTPIARHHYRIGLPKAGRWREVLNTDGSEYGGSGVGNMGGIFAHEEAFAGQPAIADIIVPPLATVYFRYEPGKSARTF